MSRLAAVAAFLIAVTGCAPPADEGPSCVPTWRLVYRHDPDGKRLAGDKDALFDAVRRGVPIRFAWGFRAERDGEPLSVEHVAEPVFLTIMSDKELVVQLPEHIGQRSYLDPEQAGFEAPGVLWRGLMSTDGTFDAVWVDRGTGQEVRRLPQRVGLSWLALLPADGCELPPPLELAVPGGVRRVNE